MADNLFYNLPMFLGVVEDRRDPQKMGRVRVRIFGVHSESKTEIPTEDLPWAVPCVGTFNMSYKPPLEGTWVFGVCIDGRDCQHPLILGVLPGMPTTHVDNTKGFNAESDSFPDFFSIWQPDINRLARAEDLENTIVFEKYSTKDEDEPKLAYNAEYPYNHVWESESGHVIEMDDTPGSERINIHHTTGTFDEYSQNGNKIQKVVGNRTTIVEKNDILSIYGDGTIKVKGTMNIIVEGDCNLTIDGTFTQNVHGDYILNTGGGVFINSRDAFFVKSSSNRQEAYLENISMYSANSITLQSTNNTIIHANTGVFSTYSKDDIIMETNGNYYLNTSGQTNIKSGGKVAAEGSRIDLNTDGAVSTDPYKSSLNRPFGALTVSRPLIGVEPIIRKFVNRITLEEEIYSSIEDDPVISEHDEG